jgi:hypothetical protein
MSNGAVFHPGHDELHGQTVVIYTSGPRTFVGRWDQDLGEMVRMVGAAIHEADASEQERDAWVAHNKTYGIAVQHEFVMVPKGEISRVVKLREA